MRSGSASTADVRLLCLNCLDGYAHGPCFVARFKRGKPSPLQTESSPHLVRSAVLAARREGAVVGVVPTMGALHAGHVSLVEIARNECGFVVATIFVNPTQFGPNEDFDRYPRTLDDDLAKCEAAGADLVFTPNTDDMYRADAETSICVHELTRKLEGAIRPGHFDGVTTVVGKLFNITLPDRAYFGQKDYQQQLIIRRMVQDLNWGIEIVTCPIIREPDGLAMSSRNRYLSATERSRALKLIECLRFAEQQAGNGVKPNKIAEQMSQRLEACEGIQLDYAVVADADRLIPAKDNARSAVALVAARLGKTRLIDNQILRFQ